MGNVVRCRSGYSHDFCLFLSSVDLREGAMIFVVLDDIIPETSSKGNARIASWSGVVGFVLMMTLDLLL